MSAHREEPGEIDQGSRQIPQGFAADSGRVDEDALTIGHVHGGSKPGEWRHGGYTILSGRVDGRSAVARRMRRLAEQIARDMGFDSFEVMPAVRQAAVMQFCRVAAAADAMWASFVANGRLPDKFWDLVSLTRKYAELLGLDRVPKDAKVLEPADLLARAVRRAA